jgi:cytochrome oxidase Cu insertion factor (SCO1/SenC/PrrC family)
MTGWMILINSMDLTDDQKRLLKEYLHRKKIKHLAWIHAENLDKEIRYERKSHD